MKTVLPLWLVTVAAAVQILSTTSAAADEGKDRFGVFNALDRRSVYGQGYFPEPLLGPEGDVERELRIDFAHLENADSQESEVEAEVEWNVGLLTLELELPYEREHESQVEDGVTEHEIEEGIGSIELSARHPIFQYVTADHRFDYTLVAALEVAIPSGSDISKDTELVPALYQLIRFGDNLSLQTAVGYSIEIGPEARGANTLEYSVTLGYNLEHEVLPIPGIARTIPLFEISGDTGLNHDEQGHNTLLGSAGARFNLFPVGDAQPRIGLGYVFPIDQGGRDEIDWGVIVSLVLEF